MNKIQKAAVVAVGVVALSGAGAAGAGIAGASGSYAHSGVREYRELPRWARYQKVPTGECGRDHTAIVVYSTANAGADGVLICRDGKVELP